MNNTISCPHCNEDIVLEVAPVEYPEEETIRCEHCRAVCPSESSARNCCNTTYKRWINSKTDVSYKVFRMFRRIE